MSTHIHSCLHMYIPHTHMHAHMHIDTCLHTHTHTHTTNTCITDDGRKEKKEMTNQYVEEKMWSKKKANAVLLLY